MNHNSTNNPGTIPNDSAEFGNVRNGSESFRTVPNASEAFGTVRNDAEGFRSIPKLSERKENHTLTVREAARLFEAAGVARTERSIINWCQPNKLGVPRLDCYFDANERKYYLTLQSVEAAIAEEKAKTTKIPETPEPSEPVPNRSERRSETDTASENDKIKELQQEIMDLKITNRGKDFFIEQLKSERDSFAEERKEYVKQLMDFNRHVGELEAKLLQLEAPSVSEPKIPDKAS